MAMTKKHYEMFARKIAANVAAAEANPEMSPVQIAAVTFSMRKLASELSAEFGAENPRFDRGRFMAACGF